MRRAALFAVALALVAAAPAADRLAAARAASRDALARHDPVAAEVVLREAVRGGIPEDAVRAGLGAALLAQGNRAEARRVLAAGGFTPDSAALGWRVRGQLLLAQGDLPAAGKAFDQALHFAPNDAELWVSIAALRFTGGEEAQAIAAADHAVALDPRQPAALAFRGLLIREQYGLAASLPWLEAGLRVRPDDPALLGEYAATLGDMGQYRAMLVVVRKLAEVDPRNPRVYLLQAVLAARAGQTALARGILQKAGGAFRDMPAAILLSGVLEYRAGNVNLAVELFDRLVRMQPDNVQARKLLARALARQGEWRQIVERFGAEADGPGATPYILDLVGTARRKLGQRAQGDALLARARRPAAPPIVPLPAGAPLSVLATGYADAPGLAANAVPYIRALIAANDAGTARAAADRLRDGNPGASAAHLLAGDVALAAGDTAGALEAYEAAGAIRFTEPVLYRMAAALRRLGRSGEARSLVARYLAQNPGSIAAMRLLADSGVDPAQKRRLEDALAARGQRAR